jgi:hypothetical protein
MAGTPYNSRRERKDHEGRPGHFLLLQFRASIIDGYILLPFRKDQKQTLLEGYLISDVFALQLLLLYGSPDEMRLPSPIQLANHVFQ